MSNEWNIHCVDCDEAGGTGINHGEEELARLLARRPQLEAVGEVEGLLVEVRGETWALPAWFVRHKGHTITVRSEYGYDFGDCAEWFGCSHCGRRQACRRKAGHDGDHAAKADPT